MAWEPFVWLFFAITNLTLLGLNFYQFLGFSDLEADYLNPYELSSRVNYVIVPEYLLHGALCVLFLFTGHWIMFLLSLPPAYYNLKLYLSNQHLVDVTEVFKVVSAEKKARLLKLGFYVPFFGLVITRFICKFSPVRKVQISLLRFIFMYQKICLPYLLYMLYLLMRMMLCLGRPYIEPSGGSYAYSKASETKHNHMSKSPNMVSLFSHG